MKHDPSIRVVAAGVLLLFAALVARLWELQVVRSAQYAEQAVENRLRVERVTAPRGIIYDRTGKPLVKNSPFYSVAIDPKMLQEADVERLADFLGLNPSKLAATLKRNRRSIDPVLLRGGLTFDEVVFIESRLSDYPELLIDVDQTRYYPYRDVGAHVLGYLGKMGTEQIKKAAFRDVPSQSFVGQWGMEKLYDPVLRGKPGRRVYEADALGRKLRVLNIEPPEHGQDIYLSIDISLQRAAERAFGKRAGAMVAIKPDTGEILALVSRPSFDPNLFSRGIDYDNWLALVNHEGHPLLNRALQTQIAPASTFKIVSALTALQEEVLTPKSTFICNGVVAKGPWKFRCWKRRGHGKLDMHESLVQSCDVYYYRTGERTGFDAIARMARKFQFGEVSGLGLVEEKTGLMPDSEWKRRVKGEPWYLGETYNAVIGQGFVLATPMQMARMMAWVSNGGSIYPLTLIRQDAQPEPVRQIDVDPKHLETIRRALRDVVVGKHGTGKTAFSTKVEIGGKTGTAQVVRLREDENRSIEDIPVNLRDHAWFVAFAPVEDTEIAVAVYVEHGGSGGRNAGPIAKRAIEAYFAEMEAEYIHVEN